MAARLPVLETPRLRLRLPVDADVPALFAIFSDPEAMRYWTTPPMGDLTEAEAYVRDIHRHAEAGTLFQWGIARREDDLVIGTCTLLRIEREHRRCELGYILRRDHWGARLAHEALTAVVDHAFGTLAASSPGSGHRSSQHSRRSGRSSGSASSFEDTCGSDISSATRFRTR